MRTVRLLYSTRQIICRFRSVPLPSRAGRPRSSSRRRAARSMHAVGAVRGRVSKLKFKIIKFLISAVCHCYSPPLPLSAIATLWIIAAVCHRHSLDHRCRLPLPLSGSSLPSAIATLWIIAAVCHRHSLDHRCRLPSPLSRYFRKQ